MREGCSSMTRHVYAAHVVPGIWDLLCMKGYRIWCICVVKGAHVVIMGYLESHILQHASYLQT